ncbi:MAG: hypothetical protein HFE73_06515 [Firmicutes bacterium]|nr:hypothetical protein [Bacillota bacterium]
MKAGKAASITVYCYQMKGETIRKLGTIPNHWAGQYGVYKDEIYRFTGFEGCTLEKWNSKDGDDTVLDHVYGEIGSLKIHDGIIGMQDEKRNYLIRYDIKTQKILERVKLDKTELLSYIQANENYAVWIGETGQVFVYCYKTEELLALCNVTEMEEKVLLFDDRLYVINGEKMWGYDLKNRKMEVKRIVC